MEPSSKLPGPAVERLQEALLAAFPTRSDLAQMVRVGLDENLDALAAQENLRTAVFELIRWAEAQGRLDQLIAAAHSANPGNPALRTFAEHWRNQDQDALGSSHTLPSGPKLEPAYENNEVRVLAERLEGARARKRALEEAGASTDDVEREILDLRRRLREGGQLRAGDALENGRYLLLKQIGRGGFASVWAALDRERSERVAIKLLHPDQAREPSRRERFFRGARVMAGLEHPAVVRVLNPHGEDGGYHYFVMELIEGEDLHHAVIGGRLSEEATVPLLLRVGEALAEAHAKGIVHRDVKPANVVLDSSGAPKLTDFDLVAAQDTTGGTRTGALGSFLFTAPEQVRAANQADARADVYGLGMTTVFCLHGSDLPAAAVRRPESVIASLRCSDEVKSVLTEAIELDPKDRYANARAFCEALRAAAKGVRELERQALADLSPQGPYPVELARNTTAPRPSLLPRPVPPASSSSWKPALVAATVLALIGSGLSGYRWWPKPPQTSATIESSVVIPKPVSPSPPADTCPEDMALIQAGTFPMGSNDGDNDEQPEHKVRLSAFCIHRTEVKVEDYRKCTKETRNGARCEPAAVGSHCNWDKEDRGQHPINCVRWTDAETYCKWAGFRLPTEAEWEYAARGVQGRTYPWGNTPPPSDQLCWSGAGSDLGEGKRSATCTVGNYAKSATPEGVQDMAGNVWEWVADWFYQPYPPDSKPPPLDPTGPINSPENLRVIRGGGWDSDHPSWVRSSNRFRELVGGRSDNVGFRCVRGLN